MAIPGLYHFFKQVDRVDDRSSADKVLPDPEGQISLKVPSSSIVSANKAAMNASLKRGSNDRFTPEKKTTVPRKANDSGTTKTVTKILQEFTSLQVEGKHRSYMDYTKSSRNHEDMLVLK